MFEGPLDESILKRARERELVRIRVHNLRDFTHDKHRVVDDRKEKGVRPLIITFKEVRYEKRTDPFSRKSSILIFAFGVACALETECKAGQYQFSGTALTESNAPVTGAAVEARNTNTEAIATERTSSNGTYCVAVTGSPGDLVTISVDSFGGYEWLRDQSLTGITNIQNINFTIPTVNTAKVSVAGVITVQGNSPSLASTILLQKINPVNGQKFTAIRGTLTGFSGTNAYQFFDLPAGDYSVYGQADSGAVTQIVISVTATNTPLRLDIDF